MDASYPGGYSRKWVLWKFWVNTEMKETLGFQFQEERQSKLWVCYCGNFLCEHNLLTGRFTWRNPESDRAVWQRLSFPSQSDHVEEEIIHKVLHQEENLDSFRWALPPWRGLNQTADRFSSVCHFYSPAAQRISGYTSSLTCTQIWQSSSFFGVFLITSQVNQSPSSSQKKRYNSVHLAFLFPTDNYKKKHQYSLFYFFQQRNFKVCVSSLLPYWV